MHINRAHPIEANLAKSLVMFCYYAVNRRDLSALDQQPLAHLVAVADNAEDLIQMSA
jgi:hypothetical protein